MIIKVFTNENLKSFYLASDNDLWNNFLLQVKLRVFWSKSV